jgi:uncharacterized protein (DUF2267 family)
VPEEANMAIDPQAALADEPLRRYDHFVRLVSDLASLSLPEAEFAVRAVIETLAEHLSDDERRELAGRLPKAMKRWLAEPGTGEQLRHGAFLHRVAEREGIYVGSLDMVGLTHAERHTRAVFDVLRLLLEPDEIHALTERLPAEARELLRPSQSRPRPVIGAEALVERVAKAARYDDVERALRATEAVLETLGERLAAGEVEDLEALLPGELRPALELGKLHARKAERFDVDEFLSRVSEREGRVTYDEALDDARFVCKVLRETLPQPELDDILAELPRSYDELLGR